MDVWALKVTVSAAPADRRAVLGMLKEGDKEGDRHRGALDFVSPSIMLGENDKPPDNNFACPLHPLRPRPPLGLKPSRGFGKSGHLLGLPRCRICS